MTITCANCGIEIRWQSTIVDGKTYCCLGCSRGGPCECDYSRLPQEGDHVCLARVNEQPQARLFARNNGGKKDV